MASDRLEALIAKLESVETELIAFIADESENLAERNLAMGAIMENAAKNIQRIAKAAGDTGTMSPEQKEWFGKHAVRVLELIGTPMVKIPVNKDGEAN
jgi:hypothetical protein